MDIFIGVDGGGSKSHIRAEDREGNLIGQAISGPANIRLSVDDAWRSVYSALNDIFKPHGISLNNKNDRFHIGLGLAGCEIQDAVSTFLKHPHPFANIALTSDAHIACMGAHNGAEGAVIIIGTGIIGYQVQAGKGKRVSGWGFPHDDEGSGAWLGLEATRLTFQWLDQRREKSPLVEDVFAYFNQDAEQFVTWANQANSTEFARLAPLVIHHYKQEEFAAMHLMKKAAHAVDRVSHTLKKLHLQESAFACCLLGGIAPFLEPLLSTESRATLTTSQADATTGALLMIRQQIEKDTL